MLKITNTLTGKKEEFISLNPHHVSMYVCGVTPYDHAHVGHGRCYVSFDMLYRTLQFLGNDVRYCRNLTDIDDKILKKSRELFGSRMQYADVTGPVIASFHEDMASLNCLPPDYEPRVTDNIDAIIAFIAKLIEAGKAYESHGDVYFSIKEYPAYGRLSGHKLEDLRAGARVDVSEKKEDPLDFALWKAEPEGEFWKSPWGWGRPGWHIECSALALKYLGSQIDIHAGGLDLIFPHHENEIAQTEALTNKPFARYWLHNGFVMINHEKMSKSLGNFFTLRDIFKTYDPMVLRYYFITHHYKAPLDFSFHDMAAAYKSYQRLVRILDTVSCDKQDVLAINTIESDVVKRMFAFLVDDLNTPGMLGVLFESLDELKTNIPVLCEVKLFLQQLIGLTCVSLPEQSVVLTPEIEQLLKEREQARAEKNWAQADTLREKLRSLGFEVQDKKI